MSCHDLSDAIILKGIRIPGYHGVLPEEQERGQVFVVDVTLWRSLSQPGQDDSLDSTTDYGRLAEAVYRQVADEQHQLIERVADRVARLVLETVEVQKVEVTVHKPQAPIRIEFEDVAVRVVRTRCGTAPVLAAISLGANLGDRGANLVAALARLQPLGRRVAVSHVYETAPQDLADQPSFYNALVLVETRLGPEEILENLAQAEQAVGRTPGVRNGPRIIDLDLILHGMTQVDTGTVQVPHPRYRRRRFVLEPLNEVWPQAYDPDGTRIADLLDAVDDQGCTPVEVAGWVGPIR